MHLTIGSMDANGKLCGSVLEAARNAKTIVLQTDLGSLKNSGLVYQSLDSLYESAQDFDRLIENACTLLFEDGMLFVALGDICANQIAAAAAARFRQAGGTVSVIPSGDPALCAAFAAGAADAINGVAIYSAASFSKAADTSMTLVINEIDSRLAASDLKIKLARFYGDAYIVFLTDIRKNSGKNIPLSLLDAEASYGYYTSIVLPPDPLELKKRFTFGDLISVMERLRSPDGCPWDKEQTHASLKRYLIEEGYEVLDAIDSGDAGALCDELGDVLLQVVFHARIAQQQGRFDDTDITTAICEKMISRHTHIFGNADAKTPEAVISNWEQIKKDEKGQRSQAEVLSSVPRSMPALMRSGKIQHKAAHVGFDFSDVGQAIEKLHEEISEVLGSTDHVSLAEECGDLLFAAVNVVRLLGVEPETALQKASDKFVARFSKVEQLARAKNIDMTACGIQTLDELWEQAKRE